MKKLFIFLTSLVAVFSVMVVNNFSAEALSKDINFEVNIGGGGGGSIANIDIASSEPVSSIKNFNGLTHTKFGSIKSIDGSVSYDKENKKTYQSNWTTQAPIYESFDVARFDTYTFEKYVDLPIKTLHSRKVAAGDSVSFTIKTTQSSEESKTVTSTQATTYYWDICHSIGYSMGISLALDLINLTSGITETNTVKVGGSFSSTISNTNSSSTKYSMVYEETFTFDNSNSSYDTYFDMNFRQKFQIYFTTRYNYNYEVNEWGSGLFNIDRHWSYTFKNYTPVGTYIYLIPLENPYFEVSKYYDNSKGQKEIIKSTTNNSIIYL